MNIEIANRLVELRKANNLSQEALAEKLGISRQAVSKWERAEASPDTDNLILLARLYKISLDDLLRTDEEIIPVRDSDEMAEDVAEGIFTVENAAGNMAEEPGTEEGINKEDRKENESSSGNPEYVHVGLNGIHVKDKDGEVHVGWNGIHVVDTKDEVHIDKDGVHVNGEEMDIFKDYHKAEFPIGLIAIVAYIAIGCLYNLWHPGWLIFLLVPVISSAIHAIHKKRADIFAYPILVVFLFLYVGCVHMIWHPTWVLFLTIPVYYEGVKFFRKRT